MVISFEEAIALQERRIELIQALMASGEQLVNVSDHPIWLPAMPGSWNVEPWWATSDERWSTLTTRGTLVHRESISPLEFV